MGSSAKKKRERKKDFQKAKLKVGKAAPKPANFTDTSFSSKKIFLPNQSLSVTAPTQSDLVTKAMSNLNAKSSRKRVAAMSTLRSHLRQEKSLRIQAQPQQPPDQPSPPPEQSRAAKPVHAPHLLARALPLLKSTSSQDRKSIIPLLSEIPREILYIHVPQILLYLRAALTNLSSDIRADALTVFSWLLSPSTNQRLEAVSCPGGWVSTLKTLLALLGWRSTPTIPQPGSHPSNQWSTAPKATSADARVLSALHDFLHAGLIHRPAEQRVVKRPTNFPIWSEHQLISRRADPFRRLNLFGPPQNAEEQGYSTRDDRARCMRELGIEAACKAGIELAKKDGGEVGRVAGKLETVLEEGMSILEHG